MLIGGRRADAGVIAAVADHAGADLAMSGLERRVR